MTAKPKHIMELMWEADAPLREAAKLHRDYMRNTKKKQKEAEDTFFSERVAEHYRNRVTADSMKKKPETLTARFEVLDRKESFEGRKLYSLRFSDIGYCYFIRVYADQLQKLRAAQPEKRCECCGAKERELFSICMNCTKNKQKEARAEGMAQGTLKTLDELAVFAPDLEAADNVYDAHNSIDNWILNKRAEAQKQEGKK